MAGTSWLVDKSRFATKIKCASSSSDPSKTQWTSNPSRSCPKCHHTINNDEIVQDWPGLPQGVKFDPSDQEIIWHLLAKVGFQNMQPHPFIDEFIPTVHEEDGICYTHPQNLPGVNQDGGACHFFHRAIKAYNTGTRKRRKIHGDELGDVRWHKTGRTKPVIIGGVQRGCKKIMVLYISPLRGGKAEKTNWVMHQYHLGTGEDEKDGEYVVSKVFYQQQPNKQSDKTVEDVPDLADAAMLKVDPVTPKSVIPEPPRSEVQSDIEPVVEGYDHGMGLGTTDAVGQVELGITDDGAECEPGAHSNQAEDHNSNEVGDEGKWWDSESQYLLNSQQLVEALSLCDDIFSSQPSGGDGNDNSVREEDKPHLSVYARLGAEDLKKDIEECQNLALDPANIFLDTPPDFRLSQLILHLYHRSSREPGVMGHNLLYSLEFREFGSQDSGAAWGFGKI